MERVKTSAIIKTIADWIKHPDSQISVWKNGEDEVVLRLRLFKKKKGRIFDQEFLKIYQPRWIARGRMYILTLAFDGINLWRVRRIPGGRLKLGRKRWSKDWEIMRKELPITQQDIDALMTVPEISLFFAGEWRG